MDESHACELLYSATLTLAAGQGGIRERLQDAVLAMHHLIPERELNQEHRQEYESIMASVLHRPAEHAAGEGTIQSTIRQMDPRDAQAVAERIFHLYGKVLHGSSL